MSAFKKKKKGARVARGSDDFKFDSEEVLREREGAHNPILCVSSGRTTGNLVGGTGCARFDCGRLNSFLKVRPELQGARKKKKEQNTQQ